jgi:hypothetical protein
LSTLGFSNILANITLKYLSSNDIDFTSSVSMNLLLPLFLSTRKRKYSLSYKSITKTAAVKKHPFLNMTKTVEIRTRFSPNLAAQWLFPRCAGMEVFAYNAHR